MPSFTSTTILALVAYAALSVNASAIPSDSLVQRELKTCPALNNYIWTSPSGASKWKIGCDRDTVSDGDHAVEAIDVDSLEDCIKTCGNSRHVNWCKSVSYPGGVNEPSVCYLKGSNTGGTRGRDGWKLAVRQ